MKKDKKDTTFRFGIIEETGKDVTIEITEEDYQKTIGRGRSRRRLAAHRFSQSPARRFSRTPS